jgi:sugar lactone lactonase YvrE
MTRLRVLLTALSATLLGTLFLVNSSCSNSTPTAAESFQNPVTSIVGINPTLSPTFTRTPTSTPSSTPTASPTQTSTPYVVNTWTGFNAPSAVAVDAAGNVYVADKGNNRVEKFTGNGLPIASWGNGGLKGAVSITSPTGVAVDGAGKLYVTSGNQVALYDATGALSNGAFSNVALSSTLMGAAVNGAGTSIVIADTGNQRLTVLDASGNLVTNVAAGVSVFGCAIDGNGDLYASTGGASDKVLRLTSGGVTIPGFSNPQGLATDAGNNLWVADMGNKQIEGFATGAGLLQPPFVVFNQGGAFNTPTGVAVDASGNIYVTDAGANTVVKFAP